MKKLKEIPVIGDVVLTNHEIYGLIHPDEPVSLIIFLDGNYQEYIIKPENIDVVNTTPKGNTKNSYQKYLKLSKMKNNTSENERGS